MSVRLTKPSRGCKAAAYSLAILLTVTAAAGAAPNSLRNCITNAKDAVAVARCEQQGQNALQQSIPRLSAGIRKRLNGTQRLTFDRSAKAWLAFVEHETVMLKLSLGLRKDGLGPQLQQGSITRLYEQREQQLREHLHNLSLAKPAE